MDSGKIQRYIQKMKEEKPGFSRLSEEQIYELLSITRKGIPTLAAILNFGLYPQGYFPQLAVTAIAVPGKEISDVGQNSERFLDNKRIEGTLSEMLVESLNFCRRNMKVRTIINPETGERIDKPEYPVEDLGKAKPDLRNPTLATMSEFLLNTENRYSGIPTIRREMAQAGLPAPVFINRRSLSPYLITGAFQYIHCLPEAFLLRENVIRIVCRNSKNPNLVGCQNL